MELKFIHYYIQDKVNSGMLNKEIAKQLGLTQAMIGQYRLNRGYKPSLAVAIRIYELDGTVLYPFSEQALQYKG